MKYDSSSFPIVEDEQLRRELLLQILRNSAIAPFAYYCLAPLYVVAISPQQSTTHIFITWASAVILISFVRQITCLKLLKNRYSIRNAEFLTSFFAILSACAWSSVVLLEYYLQQPSLDTWYGPLFTAGISAAAVTSLSAFRFIAQSYIILLLVPQILAALYFGNGDIELAAVLTVFMLFMLNVSSRFTMLINKNVSGRLQKEVLLEEVERQKLILERHNEYLNDAKKDAEEANAAKTDFLRMISHDLRTPLNSILGMVDLALDEQPPSTVGEYLEYTKNSAEHLLSLINDLLDLAAIEEGKFPSQVSDINLSRSLQVWCEPLKILAETKGLLFSVEIEDGLPEVLRCDERKLKQILSNLIANAIKFTDLGSIRITCSWVALNTEQLNLRFEVIDTGKGIPKEEWENIFQPFEQVRSDVDAQNRQGTGLGLSIARMLCTVLGGNIWVSESSSKGSRFSFELPVLTKNTETVSKITFDKDTTIKNATNLYILIAEDNPINQLVVVKALETIGCSTKVVSNGNDAVIESQKSNFDLILMDCQMPVMDGIEATKRIRDHEKAFDKKRVPIVALTAHAFDEEKKRCIDAGMDSFLTKPFKREQLQEDILRLCSVS